LVAVKVGTVPDTGLLPASFRVMVIVDVAVLSATIGPVPVMREFNATGDPAVNTTDPPALTTGVAMDRVFVSAFIDLSVQVETPEASEDEQAETTFVDPVSVALNVGTIPLTGLFEASLRVIVTDEVAVPFAITGPVPVIVEFAATAEPAVKTTVPPALTTGVAIERVLVSAVKDVRVQVDTPEASVAEHVPMTLVVPVFVAVNVGTVPDTKLLLTSFRVIVTVEEATPSAATGPDPVIVEFAATAAPAVNVTDPPDLITGVAIDRVFVSAVRDLRVQVETPEAFDEEQAV
jgi:hypothetical protein